VHVRRRRRDPACPALALLRARQPVDRLRLGRGGPEHQVGRQRIRDAGIDRELVNRRPPQGPTAELLALYRGWAAGYNAFLRSGDLRDRRCKGKPWVKPITQRDMMLRGLQIATFSSSSRLITGLIDAQPPGPGATAGGTRPARPDLRALRDLVGDSSDPSPGSNGIGLGRMTTRGRSGIGPRQPALPVARDRALLAGPSHRPGS